MVPVCSIPGSCLIEFFTTTQIIVLSLLIFIFCLVGVGFIAVNYVINNLAFNLNYLGPLLFGSFLFFQ